LNLLVVAIEGVGTSAVIDKQPGSALGGFDILFPALTESLFDSLWVMVVPGLGSSFDQDFESVVLKPTNLNWNAWLAVAEDWNPMEVVAWPVSAALDLNLFQSEAVLAAV
jgi:hypothetical protein